MNPAGSGKSFHKLAGAKDKDFWSVRVSRDVRVIVHKTAASLLLCYVDHHDDAYDWAKRRKIERHPKTGAAQLVEVRETVVEQVRAVAGAAAADFALRPDPVPTPKLFAGRTADELLGFGVPPEWVPDALAATEDSVLDLAGRLPAEAGEALLTLATGGTPETPAKATPADDPFEHPDAQRRFRRVATGDELQRALDFPWERWTVFLHPSQRATVTKRFAGPARVVGSAGTGKTVVALHRAVELAKADPETRVLLTTFSLMLARALRVKLLRLVAGDADLEARIAVRAIDHVGEEIVEAATGQIKVATPGMVRQLVANARAAVRKQGAECPLSDGFLESEWEAVVDGWQLADWPAYRDVSRAGRGNRLSAGQREAAWAVFAHVRKSLYDAGLTTWPQVFAQAGRLIASGAAPAPATHVVVDEAQDIAVYQLRFLAALAGDRPDGLFFAGDLGQRIFRAPFSWKQLGVDIRGRSQTLKVNYRTSHQIRALADTLLDDATSDVDGNAQQRSGTVSAFSGPEPRVELFDDVDTETAAVAAWLAERAAAGAAPHELGVFVRGEGQLPRAHAAITAARLRPGLLEGQAEPAEGKVVLGTMHDAKGLEFRAVAVMACDDDVIPDPDRVGSAADAAATEAVYDTERNLLYVACTRARDELLVTGTGAGSEFLEDLTG